MHEVGRRLIGVSTLYTECPLPLTSVREMSDPGKLLVLIGSRKISDIRLNWACLAEKHLPRLFFGSFSSIVFETNKFYPVVERTKVARFIKLV